LRQFRVAGRARGVSTFGRGAVGRFAGGRIHQMLQEGKPRDAVRVVPGLTLEASLPPFFAVVVLIWITLHTHLIGEQAKIALPILT
jgi:hypothetical protein